MQGVGWPNLRPASHSHLKLGADPQQRLASTNASKATLPSTRTECVPGFGDTLRAVDAVSHRRQ